MKTRGLSILGYNREIDRLEADIERLRTALERIKIYTKGNLDQIPYEIAREALRDA
jgi:hypothetical protein